MSIDFDCPICQSRVSIEGISYKLCPICGYSEKDSSSQDKVLHEEVVDSSDEKSVLNALRSGVTKLGKIVRDLGRNR